MNTPWGTFGRSRSGVSPVIGIVLLTVIVVLLAAIMATFLTGFDANLHESPPYSNFEHDFVASGEGNSDYRPYVNISMQGGDGIKAENVLVKDESGHTIKWSNIWTGNEYINATEYVHIDGFDSDGMLDPICSKGQTYYLVYEGEDGQTFVLMEWDVPRDPNLPPSAGSDSDGDGIPDWC